MTHGPASGGVDASSVDLRGASASLRRRVAALDERLQTSMAALPAGALLRWWYPEIYAEARAIRSLAKFLPHAGEGAAALGSGGGGSSNNSILGAPVGQSPLDLRLGDKGHGLGSGGGQGAVDSTGGQLSHAVRGGTAGHGGWQASSLALSPLGSGGATAASGGGLTTATTSLSMFRIERALGTVGPSSLSSSLAPVAGAAAVNVSEIADVSSSDRTPSHATVTTTSSASDGPTHSRRRGRPFLASDAVNARWVLCEVPGGAATAHSIASQLRALEICSTTTGGPATTSDRIEGGSPAGQATPSPSRSSLASSNSATMSVAMGRDTTPVGRGPPGSSTTPGSSSSSTLLPFQRHNAGGGGRRRVSVSFQVGPAVSQGPDHHGHPYLLPVEAVFCDAGRCFTQALYAPGGSLGDLLARRRQRGVKGLELGELLRATREMAAALHHLHAHGVPHGGLHLGNVLLAEDGTVMLADYGALRGCAGAHGKEDDRMQGGSCSDSGNNNNTRGSISSPRAGSASPRTSLSCPRPSISIPSARTSISIPSPKSPGSVLSPRGKMGSPRTSLSSPRGGRQGGALGHAAASINGAKSTGDGYLHESVFARDLASLGAMLWELAKGEAPPVRARASQDDDDDDDAQPDGGSPRGGGSATWRRGSSRGGDGARSGFSSERGPVGGGQQNVVEGETTLVEPCERPGKEGPGAARDQIITLAARLLRRDPGARPSLEDVLFSPVVARHADGAAVTSNCGGSRALVTLASSSDHGSSDRGSASSHAAGSLSSSLTHGGAASNASGATAGEALALFQRLLIASRAALTRGGQENYAGRKGLLQLPLRVSAPWWDMPGGLPSLALAPGTDPSHRMPRPLLDLVDSFLDHFSSDAGSGGKQPLSSDGTGPGRQDGDLSSDMAGCSSRPHGFDSRGQDSNGRQEGADVQGAARSCVPGQDSERPLLVAYAASPTPGAAPPASGVPGTPFPWFVRVRTGDGRQHARPLSEALRLFLLAVTSPELGLFETSEDEAAEAQGADGGSEGVGRGKGGAVTQRRKAGGQHKPGPGPSMPHKAGVVSSPRRSSTSQASLSVRGGADILALSSPSSSKTRRASTGQQNGVATQAGGTIDLAHAGGAACSPRQVAMASHDAEDAIVDGVDDYFPPPVYLPVRGPLMVDQQRRFTALGRLLAYAMVEGGVSPPGTGASVGLEMPPCARCRIGTALFSYLAGEACLADGEEGSSMDAPGGVRNQPTVADGTGNASVVSSLRAEGASATGADGRMAGWEQQ
eukprot:jgi/Mesvir1/12088/Mv00364-RA.1